jgi:hypothetical protein
LKTVSIILIVVGIIFGLLGVRSYWHANAYEKASTVVIASVKSAEVKPMSGKAVGSIRLVLTYLHDGMEDSIEHNYTEAYSVNNPLPTVEELKASSLYVRYVPKQKRSEKVPNWVLVSSDGEFDGIYGRSLFGQMFTFILLGLMIRLFGRRKQPI